MTEYISRKYGDKGYEIIIKTDSKEHDKAAEAFARRLIGHAKPMTNADRIRAMSDEELVDILYQFAHSNNKPLNKENLFEWLKQPAEVDNG